MLPGSIGGVIGQTASTIAGTGDPGFAGDGGPAVEAMLFVPSAVFVDVDGSVIETLWKGDLPETAE